MTTTAAAHDYKVKDIGLAEWSARTIHSERKREEAAAQVDR